MENDLILSRYRRLVVKRIVTRRSDSKQSLLCFRQERRGTFTVNVGQGFSVWPLRRESTDSDYENFTRREVHGNTTEVLLLSLKNLTLTQFEGSTIPRTQTTPR